MTSRRTGAWSAVAAVLLTGALLPWVGSQPAVVEAGGPVRAADGVPDPATADSAARTSRETELDAAAQRARTSVAVPAPSADQPDGEWLALPRSQRDQICVLVASPQSADLADLLRSVTFNPRDDWLPPGCRESVAATIAQTADLARRQSELRDAAFEREFTAARARGRGREVDLVRFPGEAQTAPLGREPFYRDVDGKRVGVARVEMPATARATRQLAELGATLVGRVAANFAAAGALTPQELEALTRHADELARR
jgi:hypothetical protein